MKKVFTIHMAMMNPLHNLFLGEFAICNLCNKKASNQQGNLTILCAIHSLRETFTAKEHPDNQNWGAGLVGV